MAQYKGAASEAGRAMQLMKKREKEREQLEQLKQKIAEVTLKQYKPPGVSSRFVPGCCFSPWVITTFREGDRGGGKQRPLVSAPSP